MALVAACLTFQTSCKHFDSEPDFLHEGQIREHVQATNSNTHLLASENNTCVLPHPLWGGFGVFANRDIGAGEIVETGLTGHLQHYDGNYCPYVFTYNPTGERRAEGQQNIWAAGGGNSMFYNSDYPPNVRMYRFFSHWRYIIVAKRPIQKGEEVMHLYASSSWRVCFVEDERLPQRSSCAR